MGLAIVTDSNFASKNLGKVDFAQDVPVTSISLERGNKSGNRIQIIVTYNPSNTNEKGVTWSILSGNEYLEIGQNGYATIREGANNASAVVKATSVYNNIISNTLVLDGLTYTDKVDELNGISLSYDEDGDNKYKMSKIFDPSNTSYTDGTWSIVYGADCADIDKDGILYVKKSGEVKVRFTSTYNDLYAELVFNVIFRDVSITFEDTVVKQICVENWGSDGEITVSQAAAVTSLNDVFKENTSIESFDELRHFTNVKTLSANEFNGCVNLKKITLPPSCSIDNGEYNNVKNPGCFYKCSSLTEINWNGVVSIGNCALSYCKSFTKFILPNTVRSIGLNLQRQDVDVPITTFKIEGGGNNNLSISSTVVRPLKSIIADFPSNTVSIGRTFINYGNLNNIYVFRGIYPPIVGGVTTANPYFTGVVKIYVPDEAVDSYKSTAGFNPDIVHPLSEMVV